MTAPQTRYAKSGDVRIALIGSVDGLPVDLSARKKHYLRTMGYGRKRREGEIATGVATLWRLA